MDVQLRALTDPTRRDILRRLSAGELCAGDIASRFRMSRPAISHHLSVLSKAGLITVRKEAQSRLYALDVAAVNELRARFNLFWDEALPRLKSVVESEHPSGRKGV